MPDSTIVNRPSSEALPVTTAAHADADQSADTSAVVAEQRVIVNALEQKTCHETDAPRILHLRNATLGRVAYTEGVQPEPRPMLPGYDSGVMCLLIAIFLILTANFRHYSTFIKTFTQDLFTVRRRANAFDENNTVSETKLLVSLVTLVCLCEAIILYSSSTVVRGAGAFVTIGLLTLLTGGYYLCQLMAYQTVGYLFGTSTGTRQWIKGFNASQSLLGLFLLVPALLLLFNPGMAPLLLSVSIALYGMARFIFISKGFRIFYDNYSSLVYFILYLCTLEIIPPVVLFRLAKYLTENL